MKFLYLAFVNILVVVYGSILHGKHFQRGGTIPRSAKGPLAWAEFFAVSALCFAPVMLALNDPELCFGAIFLLPGVRAFGDYIKNHYLERPLDYIGENSRWDDVLQALENQGISSHVVRVFHLGIWIGVAWLMWRAGYLTLLSLIHIK